QSARTEARISARLSKDSAVAIVRSHPGSTASYNDFRPPIVQCNHIAFDDAGTKAYHRAVAPHLGADHLARKHRRREPPGNGGEPRRIVATQALEDSMAGDPEGREPMQDRAWEPRGLRHRRVDMQRVRVTAEPIDQRGLRPRRQVADVVGRAL